MTKHFCYAKFCDASVDGSMFMCPTHWHMLSADLRRKVCRMYRLGIEDLEAHPDWLELVGKAKDAVTQKTFERCLQSHGVACECWRKIPVIA